MRIKTLFVFTLTIILLLIACSSSQSYPERSIGELSQVGYYTYVFPATYEAQSKWKKTIKLWSSDKQCSGFFSEDTWNPVYVIYTNDNQDGFEIRISPQDAIWDMSRPTKTINLAMGWIPTHQGDYYLTEAGQTIIKIKDSFSMDVVVSSRLAPAILAELIKHLEYAGPNPATMSNPWQTACEK